MAAVYRHIRLDKNEPFYIGISSNIERPYSKFNRNKWWHNIVKKTDYEVEILFDDLTWEESCEKEKEFIKLYGRKDLGLGTLVNLTDGGEGQLGNKYFFGKKHTEESKKKIGEKHKGNKWCLGYKHTKESKKKISDNNKGKSHPAWNKRLNGEEIINLYKQGLNGVEIAKKLNANAGHISRCIRKYNKDNI
jgi:hypothetical protein